MFFKRPPLKPVQLNNSDIFQLHTPDNINSSLLDSSIEHHHHNLAPPKKKLRIDSSFFDESFAVDPQLNPSPIPRVPSQSPTWDTASGLNGFAASSFQIYGGYLPEFFPDMTDTPSSITETSHIESKPPLSSSSSIKPQPLSSSKPQPSSGSKPPPSSSRSLNLPPAASLNLPPAASLHLPPAASLHLAPAASFFLQKTLALLLGGHWLSDAHINAAQALLRKQFPNQNGLQHPLLLAKKLQFESDNQDFVQIINISNSHWVCASNIGCPTGVVDVYDSIPQYSMGSYSLQKELAAILCTKEKTFTIRYVNVQRQERW